MKCVVNQTDLSAALARVAGIVPARCNIPILETVLLTVADGVLALHTSDLDQETMVAVPTVGVSTPGACCVGANKAHKMLAQFTKGAEVTLETGDEVLLASAGSKRATWPTLAPEDFPAMPSESRETWAWTFTAAELLKMFAMTEMAISTEETRYYLCGIYLHGHESARTIYAVATDAARLARWDMGSGAHDFSRNALVTLAANGQQGVILPAHAVKTLKRLLKKEDGAAPIALSLLTGGAFPTLYFNTTEWVYRTKLVDGTYPDYPRVIPSADGPSGAVGADELHAAVKYAASLEDHGSCAVTLTWAESSVTVGTVNPSAGSAHETVTAQWDAPAFEVGANSKYVAELCRTCAGAELRFSFSGLAHNKAEGDPSAPMLITLPAEPRATYVLMPMRV